MSTADFRRDNHYVPKLYLKNWAGTDGRLFAYRLLVSHENVPLWKPISPRGIAKHEHLYTRLAAGKESDETEKWLEREFETPAEEPIRKVLENARLTTSDWQRLIRFVACQHVRTPARLLENLQRWTTTLQPVIDDTLRNSVAKLEAAKRSGLQLESRPNPLSGYIPLRVTTEIGAEGDFGTLKAETIIGRGMWIFQIRHLLTNTIRVLQQHRWTILQPPEGIEWFTSDDPVIPLNFYGEGSYDFKGGWGNPGTEIFLPLGPRHALYTMVGKRPGYRQTMSSEQARMLRTFIAEHAHRYVFASRADPEIPYLRPRIVDDAIVQLEQAEWVKWHDEQSRAERELMGWPEPKSEAE